MYSRLSYTPSPSFLTDDQLLDQLRVDDPSQIPQLQAFAGVATEMVETYLSRYLITRDVVWTVAHGRPHLPFHSNWAALSFAQPFNWQGLARNWITLPRPCEALTGVQLGYWNGTTQPLTLGQDYWQDLSTDPARIMMLNWWQQGCGYADNMQMTLTTGFGAAASAIPQPIIQCILWITTRLYENRGDSSFDLFDRATRSVLDNYTWAAI